MNSQKGLAPVVLVFIIIALLAGGFLAWQYFNMPKEGTETPRVPEEKIIEKKIKVTGGVEGAERLVKIKEKEGKWNTLIVDNYLGKETEVELRLPETYIGYEVDYPKDWELYAEPGMVMGFTKFFEKDSAKITCSISISPIGREENLWNKSCVETQPSYYSKYYPKWKIGTSPVNIGKTSALKLTNSEFPANVIYNFGPNPNTPGTWCMEAELVTDKYIINQEGYKVAVEYGKNIMPECEEIFSQVLASFSFKK